MIIAIIMMKNRIYHLAELLNKSVKSVVSKTQGGLYMYTMQLPCICMYGWRWQKSLWFLSPIEMYRNWVREKENHYVQLAVCKEDREIFDAWFGRYLGNKMSGGEKSIDSLLAFTERKTSIFSVPFEGKEDIFRTDFDAMKINYTVMPDLKLGDGQV